MSHRPLSLRTLRRDWLLRGLAWVSTRRQRLVAWHTMRMTGVTSVTFTRDGLTWRVPAGDQYIGFGLFVDGGFEQHKITALLVWLQENGRTLGQGDVFVDIGANIGSTCIPIVSQQGCRAVAIEPVPATCDTLRENVARNGLQDNFLIVEAAIVATRGQVFMEAEHDNIGAAAVTSKDVPTAPVVGLPLHDALAHVGVRASEVALVWADVQGCETAVITTGAELWSRGVPLWAEYEPALLARHGGVEAFFEAARTHFDHFIDAGDLLKGGDGAIPQPIDRLAETLSKASLQTDVLLFRSLTAR